jgi:Transposase DDE domain
MDNNLIETDWKYLCQFLPNNLSDLAKTCGAVERWRNIKNGEELLRLILAYSMEDLSLRSTAAWSSQTDLELKDTSVLHRLRKAPPLLERVLAHLLTQRIKAEATPGPQLRINDATVLSIPGSVGTDWRMHVVYDPAHCCLLRVEITDQKGGERLDRDRPQAEDLVCGDRGLAHARGIHAVSEAGAYVLLRMHWQNIRLHDAQGELLEMDPILKRADTGDAGTIVYVPLSGKPSVRARLLIRPLPTEAANRNRQRLRRNAAKKGRTPSATALRLAGYFCLLTTLPEAVASDDVVLELYRIRWQIELFFKRCKGLLHFDQLRAFDPDLVRTYCLAKLIEMTLIQCLHEEAMAFSPWGVPRCRSLAA